MRIAELLDIAKEKTGGFGGDKLTELAASVNEAMPIITQAGFVMEQIQVTLGVPPKATLRARVVRELTDTEYETLVASLGEQVVTSVVAGTFLKAAAVHRSFRIGSMQSSNIEIELSPLPAVRFLFVPSSNPSPQVQPAIGSLEDVRLASK
jgi:hypothetical protein